MYVTVKLNRKGKSTDEITLNSTQTELPKLLRFSIAPHLQIQGISLYKETFDNSIFDFRLHSLRLKINFHSFVGTKIQPSYKTPFVEIG